MTSSTVSSESAPRSSTNEALGVTSPSSTPSCSTMICFTFSSTAAMLFLAFRWDGGLLRQREILTASGSCGQTGRVNVLGWENATFSLQCCGHETPSRNHSYSHSDERQ